MAKHIGILTSGGDCPGLNAAIRGTGKAIAEMGMDLIGFRDGFRGLVQDRTFTLDQNLLSGILTLGGTILGTSRDKPHKMPIGNKVMDMTDVIVETYKRHNLDALVCIGGGGTQKNAYRLLKAGLNIITLPKTIDNDIPFTDTSIGFDTALGIAVEAIDRLHSTATSHHRIIVVEVMGHRAGWLALGAGMAGGADVILIPEIPYNIENISEAISERTHAGKRFSIVVVAEGAMSTEDSKKISKLLKEKEKAEKKSELMRISENLNQFHQFHVNHTLTLASQLEKLTGLESRLTILGHLQRGGTPSAADRILATNLGTACAKLIKEGRYGEMIAVQGNRLISVKLKDVSGSKKLVPQNHPWIESAKLVGTCFGD
ncbi:MAG TPA: 6-phosphofructokinase [Lentisphaeria bacterium]|nr:MAG: 6-phosphofructokinase [Lentisphaerae bacterium GWF2_50_93]HCE42224.1 6-phosphofructokinase [Lentisphaeria bacterium]